MAGRVQRQFARARRADHRRRVVRRPRLLSYGRGNRPHRRCVRRARAYHPLHSAAARRRPHGDPMSKHDEQPDTGYKKLSEYMPRPLEPWVEEDAGRDAAPHKPASTKLPAHARKVIALALVWLGLAMLLAFAPSHAQAADAG